MNMIRLLCVMCCLLLAANGAYAQWTNVFQTDFFDDNPYIAGSTLNGVDGWTVTVDEALSTVQKEPDPSTNNYNSISGTSTFSTYREIPTQSAGYLRLSYSWMMTGTDVNSNNTAYGLWAMFTGTADPAANRSGMIGATYDSTAGIGTFRAFNNGPGWTSFGNFSLNTQYQLAMELNMSTRTYDVFLNGEKKLSDLKFYTLSQSNVSYLHFYRRYKAGSYAIDNVSVDVQPVPEPSSLAALATGLMGFAGFARRRRA